MTTNNQIQLFQSADGKVELEVSLEQDTAWLTQAQMCELFKRDQSVISRHVNAVFKEGELERNSNMQKVHIAITDRSSAAAVVGEASFFVGHG